MAGMAATGLDARPMPIRRGAWAIYEVFDTQGGQLFIGVTSDQQWARFVEEFSLQELAADPRLATNVMRLAERSWLIPALQEVIGKIPRDEVASRCERAQVSWAPVGQPGDLFDDPHLLATGGLVEVILSRYGGEDGKRARLPALPIEFGADRQRPGLVRQPPRVGEHNAGSPRRSRVFVRRDRRTRRKRRHHRVGRRQRSVIRHADSEMAEYARFSALPAIFRSHDAADRTPRLFRDRRAQAVEAARRGAAGGLGHRQCRGMGPEGDDAAHRADPAGRRRADARHPELGLARIRQPGRVLAHARRVRRSAHPGRAGDQRLGDRPLRADRARRARAQLGVHRPRLQPEEHAEGRRRARRHPQDQRGDPRGDREKPARLARPRPDRDLGDPRPAGRGRLRLRLRLGARRRAGRAEDARRSRSSTSPTRRNATMSR